ncbi:MAG TPA: thiamine-phosphate kinase [Candidatus Dormibacteraeota bacterium]
MGEEGVLARLTAAAVPGEGVLVGPGDDAAVWQPPAGMAVVVSQDALVEGEDFRRDWTGPHQLGRRCLEVALSDLAAMGAVAGWCTATVCAPSTTILDDVLALTLGLRQAGGEAGCSLVGGDLSGIRGPLVVDVCVGGWVDPGRVLRRDAGRAGDRLAVTGSLGGAAAGLRVLHEGAPEGASRSTVRGWLDAQLRPRARLAEGRRLAELGVRCAGDLSDGLLVDAGRTAAASGCRAEIVAERLPLAAGLREAFPEDWRELALGGGEDFELLVAAPPAVLARAIAAWPAGLATLTEVGVLREGAGVGLVERGAPRTPPRVQSRHFT